MTHYDPDPRGTRVAYGRAPGVSLLSAAAVIIAAAVPVYRTLPGTLANTWTLATYALILGCLLLGFVARPRWFGIWLVAGYGTVAAGFASTISSGAAGLFVAVQLFLALAVAPFVLRALVIRHPRLLIHASASFVLVQTVSASAGIAQLTGANVLGWVQINDRSPGLAGHPNVLGVMAGVAILLCLDAMLARRGRVLARVLVFMVLLINVGALITTGSLSAMSATVFGVLVLFYGHGFRLARILTVATLSIASIWVVILIPAVSALLRNPVDRFLQVTGQTAYVSTLDIREQTYDAAWAYIVGDPLAGRGLAAENAAARDYGTVVHNVFLRAWYQGGILLAVAIAALIAATLILVVQCIVARKYALPVGIIVVMLSYALTSAFFEQAYYWLPVIASWAALPVDSMDDRDTPRTRFVKGIVR